jgi:hypothetical protein
MYITLLLFDSFGVSLPNTAFVINMYGRDRGKGNFVICWDYCFWMENIYSLLGATGYFEITAFWLSGSIIFYLIEFHYPVTHIFLWVFCFEFYDSMHFRCL